MDARASVHSATSDADIVIDDKLKKDTLRLTGLKTKREAMELGLRTLLHLDNKSALIAR